MSELKPLVERIRKFNEDRDWSQFYNPKDLAITLVLEATEVMEHFQWKSNEEMTEYLKSNKQQVADELADVFHTLLNMCDQLDVDLVEAFNNKFSKTEAKYPVEKARGNNKKYTNF